MSDQGSANINQQDSVDVENQTEKERLLKHNQKLLEEKRVVSEKLKTLEAQQQSQVDSKLKENNEWKLLAEQKEKSYLEVLAELEEKKLFEAQSIKLHAFNKHLDGKIKNSEYYRFVDVDKIILNPDSKVVDDDSVKSVVADFVKNHSSLVEFKTGRMPNEAGSTGKIVGKDVSQMTSEEIQQHIKGLHASGKL
jgi:hypothetical protein